MSGGGRRLRDGSVTKVCSALAEGLNLGASQLPVTSAPGDPTPPSVEITFTCANLHTDTHNK